MKEISCDEAMRNRACVQFIIYSPIRQNEGLFFPTFHHDNVKFKIRRKIKIKT